jgi:hypothetical protein
LVVEGYDDDLNTRGVYRKVFGEERYGTLKGEGGDGG